MRKVNQVMCNASHLIETREGLEVFSSLLEAPKGSFKNLLMITKEDVPLSARVSTFTNEAFIDYSLNDGYFDFYYFKDLKNIKLVSLKDDSEMTLIEGGRSIYEG